ncbi:hypothetical protein [Streptomyces sp. C10-9-1]|uniref:hypothetical protein n=1 Tax=Streptomyces sp. C10-9-1 TaxID=1859285 RepID=UPI003F49D0F2
MDLTRRALRAAAARPRVLPAALPGGTPARLEAERLLRLRDWPVAATPAGADLLLVTGPDCPALHEPLERLWGDLPAPRARVHAATAAEVASALDAGRERLAAWPGHGSGAQGHAGGNDRPRGHPGRDDRPRAHPEGGGGHTHGHAGDGGTGTGMPMPGGLPLAETGPDRDGLALDRLHLALGPFLCDWPTGLTVRLVLQGDVVQEAVCETPAASGGVPFWSGPWLRAAAGEPVTAGAAARHRAAATCDSLGRLLAVAGWPEQAVAARRLRDELLAGTPGGALRGPADRLARRVGRSRVLAWLTRGIGRVDGRTGGSAPAGPPGADGDATDRYRRWLDRLGRDVRHLDDPAPLDPWATESPRGPWEPAHPPSAALLALLPPLLAGAELAAARLVVAGLDPDPEELAGAGVAPRG